MMLWDFTVRDVIEVAVIGGGWLATIIKIDSRLKSVEEEVRGINNLEKFRERMETEMQYMRRDISELRHGPVPPAVAE
jgi:hypothetical protein